MANREAIQELETPGRSGRGKAVCPPFNEQKAQDTEWSTEKGALEPSQRTQYMNQAGLGKEKRPEASQEGNFLSPDSSFI